MNMEKGCEQTVPDQGSPVDAIATEQAIARCVELFYARARKDVLLAPVFDGVTLDWDDHFKRIGDFWSKVLLGTTRYDGHAFPVHMKLSVEPEHFTRWLELFEETANETLTPRHAEMATAKARHMSHCMQVGIFPFTGADGRPARLPG